MIDKFGRKINYLRLSVTDRCDLRCTYCMPKKNNLLYKKNDILSLSDLKKITKIFINLGIEKIRITGGEPLIRKDIMSFLEYICSQKEKKFSEILITTNGTQLKKYAKKIASFGIKRINISLDTLNPEKFKLITNGGNLSNVMDGIKEAKKNNLEIKINSVLLKKFNENEILDMVRWCSHNKFKQSFIEVMPIGKLSISRESQFLPVTRAMEIIKKEYGLKPSFFKTNGPSRYYTTEKFDSTLGFISPISNNFCASCNRIRVTSNGLLFSCLGDNGSINLKNHLDKGDVELNNIVKEVIFNKPEKHSFSIKEKGYINNRFMNSTGG